MKIYILAVICFISMISMIASIFYMDDRDKEEDEE